MRFAFVLLDGGTRHGRGMAELDVVWTRYGRGTRYTIDLDEQEGAVKKFVNEYGASIHRVPRVRLKEKRQIPSTHAGQTLIEATSMKVKNRLWRKTTQAEAIKAKERESRNMKVKRRAYRGS